jgi:hypothetical protein
MSVQGNRGRELSEEEIDQIVVAQAENDGAWEKLAHRRARPASLSIPAELAARAAFLARLHRMASMEEWLRIIIQERVELEEAAFAGVKQELTARHGNHSAADGL